jgi:hypothetical protein
LILERAYCLQNLLLPSVVIEPLKLVAVGICYCISHMFEHSLLPKLCT